MPPQFVEQGGKDATLLLDCQSVVAHGSTGHVFPSTSILVCVHYGGTTVTFGLNSTGFWDVTPYNPIEVRRRFRRNYFVQILFLGVASCCVRYQDFIMVAVNRNEVFIYFLYFTRV
jgi:hypothetical protein